MLCGAKLRAMDQEKMLGQTNCGVCTRLFRFEPGKPVSAIVGGVRQLVCPSCFVDPETFANAWRSAFGLPAAGTDV